MKDMNEILVIDNSIELKKELFNRKFELMKLRIHGTLKKDPAAILLKRKLIEECNKIHVLILKLTQSNQEQQVQKLKKTKQPQQKLTKRDK